MHASLVVPTRHEEVNVPILVARLMAALASYNDGAGWDGQVELLFVDDSNNLLTVEAIDDAALEVDPSVLYVHRIHRPPSQRDGLSGAIAQGIRAAKYDAVVIADADLQHPPEDWLRVAAALQLGVQAVLPTRYRFGGSSRGLSTVRRLVSRLCGLVAHVLFPRKLRWVSDPTSGFAGLWRPRINLDELSAVGWKFLIEALVRSDRLDRFIEIGYTFNARAGGKSNATARQGLLYFKHLAILRLSLWLKPLRKRGDHASSYSRMIQFAATGLAGWLLGLWILRELIGSRGWTIPRATVVMLVVTIGFNVALNMWTWRGRQLRPICVVKAWVLRLAIAVATLQAIPALVGLRLHANLDAHYFAMGYLQANTVCVVLGTIVTWALSDRWVYTSSGLLPSRSAKHRKRRVGPAPALATAATDTVGLDDTVVFEAIVADKPPAAKVLPQWPATEIRTVHRLPPALRRTVWVLLWVVTVCSIGYCLTRNAHATIIALIGLVTVPMIVVQERTLALTAHYWRTPWDADANRDRLDEYEKPSWTFDILIAASHEEGVLFRNLHRTIEALDYPRHMFRLIVGVANAEDEAATIAEARQAEAAFPGNIKVVLVDTPKRSKPNTLVELLPYIQADLSFWLDAESVSAERLLLHFNTLAVRHPEVGVWQGGVQLMNIWAPHRLKEGSQRRRINPLGWRWGSAWRGHNCVEYYVWFKSRMRYQASKGFITLGGNTVLMWSHLLKEVSWRDVPTEDCDQGVRLSVMGIPIRSFYVGDLVTREETPVSILAHSVQRRRWNLGFFEVMARAEWRQMRSLRRRLLAYELLSLPFWQAISGVIVPLATITAFLIKAPVLFVLWTCIPAFLSITYAGVLVLAFREFCREYQLPVTWAYLVRFVLFMPFYMLVLAFAALRAVKRFVLRQWDWGKTKHTLAHAEGSVFTNESPEPVQAG